MPRHRFSLVAIPAAVGLMLLCPPSAAAAPTSMTSSLLPSPTTQTRTASPSLNSQASACAFPTVMFNGASYCPASIAGVRATTYPAGTRVVLKGITVTTVTSSTVTVAAWVSQPCPQGKLCGASLTLESLTVTWRGTSRPAYGDVINLFGTTITASITPVGYIKTGYCPIDWC